MALLAMVKLKGDPERLLAAKREFMDPVAGPVFAEHGHISQITARSDEGLLIFNLWEDAEGRDHANADSAMRAARDKIAATTGATAEYVNWPVIEHKTTMR